jgi:hypothetical protein
MPAGLGLASVGSSIAGGILGSNAAGAAAQAAQTAAANSNQVAGGVYSNTQNNLNPYIQTGQSSNNALAGLLGIGGNPAASSQAFQNYLGSTNYQFQLGQGEQAIDYANAPSFNSGATAKALNNYAQGQAGNALQGYEGLLTGLSGQGLQAGSTLGSLGSQYASQVSSNNLAAAGVQGSADLASANSITNALKGVLGQSGQTSTQSSFGSSPLSSVGNALNGAYNFVTGNGGGGGSTLGTNATAANAAGIYY